MFSRPSISLAPLLGLFPADLHLSWNAVPWTGLKSPAAVRKQKDYFMFLTYANIVYTTQYNVWVFGNSLTFPTHVHFVFALAPAPSLENCCFAIHPVVLQPTSQPQAHSLVLHSSLLQAISPVCQDHFHPPKTLQYLLAWYHLQI